MGAAESRGELKFKEETQVSRCAFRLGGAVRTRGAYEQGLRRSEAITRTYMGSVVVMIVYILHARWRPTARRSPDRRTTRRSNFIGAMVETTVFKLDTRGMWIPVKMFGSDYRPGR